MLRRICDFSQNSRLLHPLVVPAEERKEEISLSLLPSFTSPSLNHQYNIQFIAFALL